MRGKGIILFLTLPFCLSAETVVSHYHRVKPGETLSSIARKYNVPLSTLMKQNSLSSTSVKSGQRILVQKKSLALSSSKKQYRTYKQKYATSTSVASSTSISYYTVKKGDNLSAITRKTGISVAEIKRLNNLRTNFLTVGQRLKLKAAPVFTLPEVEPKPILPVQEKIYYRVKEGDTLESIAEQFGISAESLRQSNLLGNGPLRKNQILVIPPSDDQQSSETEVEDQPHQLTLNERLVQEAKRFLETPYRLGGDGWLGIDCSGLVRKVYCAVGLNLPSSSQDQFRSGIIVSLAEAQPGDLVFFRQGNQVDHVGIYIGNNQFIHASSLQRKVTIGSLANEYFLKHFAGIRRYLGTHNSGSLLVREEKHVDTP